MRKFDGSHPGGATFVAVSPDGKRVASCGKDNLLRLWDVATGEEKKVFKGHQESVHGIVDMLESRAGTGRHGFVDYRGREVAW